MLRQSLGTSQNLCSVDLNARKILNFGQCSLKKVLKQQNCMNKVKCQQLQLQNSNIKYLESEAGQFLFNYGLQKDSLENVQFRAPEIFELSAYHLGSSILRYKEAGLSEDIFATCIRYVFHELNLYYLVLPKYSILMVEFLNLIQKYVGVNADCSFRLFTRIFLFGNKFQQSESWKFLDSQIGNTKSVLQVLQKHFTQEQIYEVVSSNPDILCKDSKELKSEMQKMYFSLKRKIGKENQGVDKQELATKFCQLLIATDFF
eukprot:TRINITY_DN7545_c0_g1_i1.p1 TRINITY_DN7545_c0_g1~~TRINITY_DN7545_c0_g1_i1.p1  ORF type:complete len:260 (-),score=17.57 TRINITY_DN7545_c0_g1_i1:310-1089(-)